MIGYEELVDMRKFSGSVLGRINGESLTFDEYEFLLWEESL